MADVGKSEIDFAIITAVREEHEAVQKVFYFRDSDRVSFGSRVYWKREVKTKHGTSEIVTIQSLEMGSVSAAVLTADLINHWHPRAILLVGVGAAIDKHLNLGDIVVGEEMFYYDAGKIIRKGKLPEPKLFKSDATLISHIRSLPKKTIPYFISPEIIKTKPNIYHGTIISVNQIVADPKVRNSIIKQHRKALALEMEGYGLAEAIWESSNESKHLIIKSIMDKADGKKGDGFKVLAAENAAKYAKAFIYDEPLGQFHKNNLQDSVSGKSKTPKNGELPNPAKLPVGSSIPFSLNEIFSGRQKYLLRIAETLPFQPQKAEPLNYKTAITGIGGVGKTQLAVEFCYLYGCFFHSVHWINAGGDIDAEIADCGLRLGIMPWPEKQPEQVQATLREWARGRPRLIVFDNVEKPDNLRKWIPQLTGMRILISSRFEGWPKDLGVEEINLDVLNEQESRDLLHRLAERLNQAPDDELNQLSQRLGYLPLALYIAGSYLNDRPNLMISKYLREIDEKKKGLKGISLVEWANDFGPTGHIQDIFVTFDLGWKGLSKKNTGKISKQIFCACGYCAPNVAIPQILFVKIINVKDESLIDNGIMRLCESGFLSRGQAGPSIHPLVAEYARLKDNEKKTNIISKLADALGELTYKALESGFPQTMSPFREHIEPIAKWAEKRIPKKAGRLWNHLGAHQQEIAEFSKAKTSFEHALTIDEKLYGSDHPAVAIRINNLGDLLREMGDFQGSKEYLERALAIDEKFFGKEHIFVATIVNNLGGVLRHLGDFQGAKQYFERALAIDEKAFGKEHPSIASIVGNLGGVMSKMGDLQGAKISYERALAIDQQAYGNDHPKVAKDVNNLGGVMHDLGDFLGAKAYYERALAIDEKTYGKDHPTVAIHVSNLGRVLLDLGDLRGAKIYFDLALTIDEKVYGSNHRAVASDLSNLGDVLKSLGNLQEAKTFYERALVIDEQIYGNEHPNVAIHLKNLGEVLNDLGNLQGAMICYKRALEILKKFLPQNHE